MMGRVEHMVLPSGDIRSNLSAGPWFAVTRDGYLPVNDLGALSSFGSGACRRCDNHFGCELPLGWVAWRGKIPSRPNRLSSFNV